MVCLGLEPGVAGWKAQTNPLSYAAWSLRVWKYFPIFETIYPLNFAIVITGADVINKF